MNRSKAVRTDKLIEMLSKYSKPEEEVYSLWFDRDLVEQYNDTEVPLTEEEWEEFEEAWHDIDLQLVDVFNTIISNIRNREDV
jgi:hypothetical protein